MHQPSEVTVLVVDDDPDVTTFLATILEDAGMQVMTAHDGFEALDRLREKIPDVISLDLVMPGKSGVRVLHELRKHPAWSRIPVLVVSGHTRDEAVKRDLATVLADTTISGPSLYLEKPVTPEKYLDAVCRVAGVEIQRPPEQVRAPERSAETLRHELEALLRNADESSLRAALEALRSPVGAGGPKK